MKIKYYVILFFAFFAALIIFGCEPSGIGSDAFDNGALKDATIITYPPSDSVLTSESGNFFIYRFYLNSNPQEIMIIAEKPGYQTAQVKLNVRTDETANATIQMVRK
ncbi:MAG: hypothetical protein NTU73_00205 [Ignavibacteriae bacterium]|nr:hypothetical protein [Ignavibacteriota bacterium]